MHKTGIVTANAGQTVDLLTIGPFRFTLACRAGTGTVITGEIDLTSSEDHVSIETSSTAQAADFAAGLAYPLTDISTSSGPRQARLRRRRRLLHRARAERHRGVRRCLRRHAHHRATTAPADSSPRAESQ